MLIVLVACKLGNKNALTRKGDENFNGLALETY